MDVRRTYGYRGDFQVGDKVKFISASGLALCGRVKSNSSYTLNGATHLAQIVVIDDDYNYLVSNDELMHA